jgi:hypothetical protein
VVLVAADVVSPVHGIVADDELVVDRICVAEHEPYSGPRLDPDRRGQEMRVIHGEHDCALRGGGRSAGLDEQRARREQQASRNHEQ